MIHDPIVEEVRKAREDYARQFNFDLRAMIADLERRTKERGANTVSFPPKRRSAAAAAHEKGDSAT